MKVKKSHYSTKKLDTIRHLIPYVIYVCRAIVGRLAACNMEMKQQKHKPTPFVPNRLPP